ncbi:MAG TPA: ATP-grasp domain-containing protein [Actinomycetota bacterium]|nr:ATP-grasp domain-containing protein [Actinomycetota bacterium]
MIVGILGWDYEELETLTLRDAAANLGHEPWLFTLQEVSCVERDGRLDVLAGTRRAAELDVVIVRAQLRYDRWKLDNELLTALSGVGVPMLDPAPAFVDAESKIVGLQRAAAAGLHVPPTALCRTVADVRAAWERWDRDVVVKPTIGFGGSDVEHVAGDFSASEADVGRLLETHEAVLVQPYMPHPDGDVRVTVIGDQTLSFRRIPPEGGWKANVACGASAEEVVESPALRDVAVTAARAMNLTIAGIDIIEHRGHPVVVEINNCPGWYPLPEPRHPAYAEACVRAGVAVAESGRARVAAVTGAP